MILIEIILLILFLKTFISKTTVLLLLKSGYIQVLSLSMHMLQLCFIMMFRKSSTVVRVKEHILAGAWVCKAAGDLQGSIVMIYLVK